MKSADYLIEKFEVVEGKCTIDYEVQWNLDLQSGFFEFYDLESGGDYCHAEGCLEFTGSTLDGYDGVFELPSPILEALERMGADISGI
tara:strand:- start:56 stop:319 length:264 start_codon:yes stop_codon:yes gene_type:complete